MGHDKSKIFDFGGYYYPGRDTGETEVPLTAPDQKESQLWPVTAQVLIPVLCCGYGQHS